MMDNKYNKYKKMIYKLVWRYARIGYEFDELLSEANWAYVRACKTFNPDKSKFCTHLYNTVNGHLHNFTKPSIDNSPITDNMSKDNYNQQRRVAFKDILEKSGDDVVTIINLIFNMPERLAAMCNEVSCPKVTRRRLTRYLVTNSGWKPARAQRALSTIQEIVRS